MIYARRETFTILLLMVYVISAAAKYSQFYDEIGNHRSENSLWQI
jgi:hypothetical protein